jgi:DNA-binding XRE family transcriptional regulator
MPQVRTLTPDGEAIRRSRLELGLTPEQLGAKIGRHPQTIRGLERGAIPKVSEILAHQLARALGKKVPDLTLTQIAKSA